MQQMIRGGVPLAFYDNETSNSALVLIHGWGCDHTVLLRQQVFFAETHRVVNLDLRRHGESGSPEQVYSVAQFAHDVAGLCHELDIERAAMVVHSMGGAVAIETAYRHPELVQAVGSIDSVFQAPSELIEMLAPLLPGLHGSEYENNYRNLPTDLAELTSPTFSNLPRAPQHVLLSTLQQHMEQHNFAGAAASCLVPAAYIRAARPLANLASLQQAGSSPLDRAETWRAAFCALACTRTGKCNAAALLSTDSDPGVLRDQPKCLDDDQYRLRANQSP